LSQLGDFVGVFVNARGRGDLALLWDRSVLVQFLSSPFNHIDSTIQWKGKELAWRFTGIYGWPEAQNLWKTSQMIFDLHSHSHSTLPWLVGGDLNEIFYTSEKKDGPPKSLSKLDAFRNAFIDNELYDQDFLVMSSLCATIGRIMLLYRNN